MKNVTAYLTQYFNELLVGIGKFNVLLTIVLLFVVISCQNNSIEPLAAEDINIQELLVNSEDEEETQYDLTLLKIGEALGPWINDYENRVLLSEENSISKDGGLKISDAFVNKSLKGRLADKFNAVNNQIKRIESELKYNNVNFKTVLYVPNHKTADFKLAPIIAIGTDIEDEEEDVIPGWYYNKLGNKVYITISEDDAMASKRLVFIINGEATNYTPDQVLASNDKNINARVSANPTFTIDRYSISQRYDRSRRSEYSYVLLYRFANGGWGHPEKREEIREIHKRDINKTFYDDKEIWQVKWVGDVNRLYVATFEHDWWTPKKYVDWGGGIGITVARMKFPWEWYQKFWIDVPRSGTVTISSKGHIVVK